MATDRQAARRGFDVADGDWYGGCAGVFGCVLICYTGERWRSIHRIDGQNERPAGGGSVGIGDGDGDRGCAGLIGRRREGERAIRAAAAKEDIRIRDQALIEIGRASCRDGGGGLHVADGEGNGGRWGVFGG